MVQCPKRLATVTPGAKMKVPKEAMKWQVLYTAPFKASNMPESKKCLVADGCAGQNKNSAMICTILWWLQNEVPAEVSKVALVFPVTGHSFLPPDRVFGRIKNDIMLYPKLQIVFAEHGTVLELGKHWDLYMQQRC
ncbi:hypothetical protein HPB48_016415 [Haemaphysalis longicornis]|uniref:Uncharacterized protein n=1 Tax=Haemaphysalis longicornis TaxID=44386 RepID=A0A9J6GVP0_HAELO|nr:hypothetical protein HPB48_016415 [Haemaphysalis longicornis]